MTDETERDYSSIIFTPEEQMKMIEDLLPKYQRSQYHEYINSDEWKQKADKAKEKVGNRCQLCHVSGYARTLHVHHNNYQHLGNEREYDLVVLCADCHKLFHDSGMEPGRQVWPTKEEFSLTLKNAGVTYTNEDPWYYYEVGKSIICHMNDLLDHQKYDLYNKVNSEILDAALTNIDRRNYQRAKDSDDWDGYYNEYDWRSANDYWDGWR